MHKYRMSVLLPLHISLNPFVLNLLICSSQVQLTTSYLQNTPLIFLLKTKNTKKQYSFEVSSHIQNLSKHFQCNTYVTMLNTPLFLSSPVSASSLCLLSHIMNGHVMVVSGPLSLSPSALSPSVHQAMTWQSLSLYLPSYLSIYLWCSVWLCPYSSLSLSVATGLFLSDGHGGVDVSGEAFVLAPLNCNLASLKDSTITSLSPHPLSPILWK